MGYIPLQKLWKPANSGHGNSKNSTPTQRVVNVLGYSEPVLAKHMGPRGAARELTNVGTNTAEAGLVNRHAACIEFYSIASAESAKFAPLDVEYSESFTSEWNHVSVYGRNDPLSTFQGTQRKISLSFVVNATSPEHARRNMIEISNLASLMYPTYRRVGSTLTDDNDKVTNQATQIHTAPLLRVHFNNLIVDPSNTTDLSGTNGMAKHVGLVCALSDLQINPVFENGVIATTGGGEGTIGFAGDIPKDKRLYPKTFKIQTSFTVYHTFPLGFERDIGSGEEGGPNSYDRAKRGFGAFPYSEKHVYGQDYVEKRNKRRKAADAKAKQRKREAEKKATK